MALVATRKQLAEYRKAQAELDRLVRAELDAIWQLIADRDLNSMRNILVEAVPAVIDKYGSASATIAAEWYEELVQANAFVPDLYSPDTWAASTRWALSPLYDFGDSQTAFIHLVSATTRHVRGHGRKVIDESVRRERNVSYARVPTGAETCDFCLVLASRGPVYGTPQDARFRESDGGKYHSDCYCEPVPMRGVWVPDSSTSRGVRWEGDRVAGYNFDRLYAEEYEPFWQKGDKVTDVTRRRRESRQ